MNKKIFTKVVAFVLVVCLLLPIIPDLGLDLAGVTSSAAIDDDSFFYKGGSSGYYAEGAVNDGEDSLSITKDGVTYVPVGIIPVDSFAEGTGVAEMVTIDGVDYLKAEHGKKVGAFGGTDYYFHISNMNLVAVAPGDPLTYGSIFDGVDDDTQIAFMKGWIFDSTGANSWDGSAWDEYVAQDVIEASSYESLTHPYLLADQDEFNSLREVYTTGSDEVLKGYLDSLVAEAESIYNSYATVTKDSDTGEITAISIKTNVNLNSTQTALYDMPYYTSSSDTMNGYDSGGRQDNASSNTLKIAKLAYAYQVTGEQRFSWLAFQYAACISAWEHWGASHFLNAADAAYSMALAYDWCYNDWVANEATYAVGAPSAISTDTVTGIRNALFIKGVYAGMYNTIGETNSLWFNNVLGSEDSKNWFGSVTKGAKPNVYSLMVNNWNSVCTSGMVIAALALINDTNAYSGISFTGINADGSTSTQTAATSVKVTLSGWNQSETYYFGDDSIAAACAWLINNNLNTLETYGLDFYAPDGSYLESASYWNYGTSALFRMVGALESTCGTDFGVSSCWGLDQTAYFSYAVQTGEGLHWVYHDDASSGISTPVNGLYGSLIGDSNIVSYRKYLLTNGADTPSFYDTFNYDASITDNQFDGMPLDYQFLGMEGYSTRDSWQAGSVYAAFMGGPQSSTHTQLDSGAFVYYNNGVKWFEDIGCESYNPTDGYAYGQKLSDYVYYPSSAEGNNTLVKLDLEYGQNWGTGTDSDTDKITGSYYASMTYGESTAYGSYAILDQSEVYGVTGAKRGMLTTNDRKTVIIQDEVAASGTYYWFGHINKNKTVTISDDGKTAYITDGSTTIRCSIVTNGDQSYQFEVKDASYANNVLSGSVTTAPGGTKSIDSWQRLSVKCEASAKLELAIVIEEIYPGSEGDHGYTWTSMSSWSASTPVSDAREYDGKILLDKNFDSDGIGEVTYTNGNISSYTKVIDGNEVMGIFSNSSDSRSSNLTLAAASARVESSSIGAGMLIVEFDVATLDRVPENLTLGIYGTDVNYPIIGGSLADETMFGGIGSEFKHITIVINEDTDLYYIYLGNTLITSGSFVSKSYQDLALKFTTAEGTITEGTVLIDNVVIRTFTDTYTELDSVLAGTSTLSGWSDNKGSNYTYEESGVVAYIYNVNTSAPEADKDTPVVDIFGNTTITRTDSTTTASSESNKTPVYTFAELETLINTGKYTNVDLERSMSYVIKITTTTPLTVNANYNTFLARATNMICHVDGQYYDYSVGTLNVTYIVDGTSYVTTANSSDYASYSDFTSSTAGNIIYTDNGDGTRTFYYERPTDTWSATDGGEALYGMDLVVTNENNVFYLAGKQVYNGLYVVSNDGSNFKAGGDSAQFFTTDFSAKYTHIYLTGDIYYDGSNDSKTATLASALNLYLNGYSITFTTTVTSDHMFSNNAYDFNITGPGTLNNNGTQSNVIAAIYGTTRLSTTTVTNVTINAAQYISDHRSGTLIFKDCDITSTTGMTFFSVNSYKYPVYYSITGEYVPNLIIDGGSLNNPNLYTGGRIFDLTGNAHVTVQGGVEISYRTDNGRFPVCMTSKEDATDCWFHIGEAYFEDGYLFTTGGDYTVPGLISAGQIAYSEGAGFVDNTDALNYSYLDSTTNTVKTIAIPIATNNILAMTGNEGYAYEVVNSSNACIVTWEGAGVTEYWKQGVTPRATGTAKTYLASLTPNTGYKYTYDMSALEGGKLSTATMSFSPAQMPNLQIRMSMALDSEFRINFFFQKDGMTETLNYTSFKINGVAYEPELTREFNGNNFWMIPVSITPGELNENFTIYAELTYGSDTTVHHVTASTSITNYANKILNSTSDSAELKTLMHAIMNYGVAANNYGDDSFTAHAIDAMLNKVTVTKASDVIENDATDTSALKDYVTSAKFNLDESPNYIFALNPNFTGTLKIDHNTLRAEVCNEYNIVNGVDQETGLTYIVLSMRAYDIDETLTFIVDGTAVGTYSLAVYYTKAVQSADELNALLKALKAYCVAARDYKESL